MAEHGPLPDGPVVATPGKGRHLHFAHPPGLRNTASRLGRGIDTRGDGGQVAVPPSTRPDGAYTWLTPPRTPLPALPAWLTPAIPEPAPVRDQLAVATATDRVIAGLVRVVDQAPVGTRHDRLFWAACRLGEHVTRGRVPPGVGAPALLAAAARVGLPEAEATRTLDCGLRTGAA